MAATTPIIKIQQLNQCTNEFEPKEALLREIGASGNIAVILEGRYRWISARNIIEFEHSNSEECHSGLVERYSKFPQVIINPQ